MPKVDRRMLFALLENFCASVAKITPNPVGSGIRVDEVPPVWKDQRSVFGRYDSKQLATLAYMNAALHIVSMPTNPPPRLVIDEDTTKIPFGRRLQAHNTRRFFLGEGKDQKEVVPEIARAPKPAPLQLADLYAYSLAHALDPEEPHMSDFQRILDAGQLVAIPQPPLQAAFEWKTVGDQPESIADRLTTIWVLVRADRTLNILWAPSNGGGHWVAAKLQGDDTWQQSLAFDTYEEAMASARKMLDAYLAEGWQLAPISPRVWMLTPRA